MRSNSIKFLNFILTSTAITLLIVFLHVHKRNYRLFINVRLRSKFKDSEFFSQFYFLDETYFSVNNRSL